MNNESSIFHSPLAKTFDVFIHQKRTLGYRYQTEAAILRRFDRFLVEQGLDEPILARRVVEAWMAKRGYERPRTHATRTAVVRQFAHFMLDRGMQAYVLPSYVGAPVRLDFVPYIFSREEIRRMLAAVDALPSYPISPKRGLIMPEVFRILYGCGMRVGEVLRLRVDDVDLTSGVLRIREGKFRKDRFVPVADGMLERLRRYNGKLEGRLPQNPFFPAPHGSHYSTCAVYTVFRQTLRDTGIPHGGRGNGPRLHDLRHTFAVHRLENWIQQGADLGAKLPVLAAYLGHQSIAGTQRYLRLTPHVFPGITAGLEKVVGHAIPQEVPE